MGALHGIVASGDYFAFDLIGYTTGLLVTVLLLVLTLRAAKLPGTPLANIGFAACALLWTAGGLANALLLASGVAPGGRPALLAQAVQYSGGAVFPILILAIWRPFAMRAWQKTTIGILLVPIVSDGRADHLLLVTPGSARPGLVSYDLNYLQAVAAQCGARLDALRREREAIERVTEAELRALRAQINPHFLFNPLNTIADPIVRDPPRAEAMTLRLAGASNHRSRW